MRGGVFACALAVFAAAAAEAEPPAQDRVEAGCRVRATAVDERGVASVHAHCEWDEAPAAVLAILRDPARLAAALDSLAECQALPGGRFEVHSLGWPLADRQVTLDWREQALPKGGARFSFGAAASQAPLEAGRVQIAIDEGYWEVGPRAGGGTRLDYHSRYQPGGNLSPEVVRHFQRAGVARALTDLRAAAEASTAISPDVAAPPPPLTAEPKP